jgi:predicted nucleotide-binding protein (sugar kinase/HSP70/actin superfamily)
MIVGELYLEMEPYANLDIEKKLAELGVEVYRPLCLSSMIKDAVFPWKQRRITNYGNEFIKYDLGAHAGHAVGHSAFEFSRNGVDGVIQVYPFTCMPEQSAREILPNVSKEYKKPILSLSFDEHAAEAGFLTRLEAFVETIYERRIKNDPFN